MRKNICEIVDKFDINADADEESEFTSTETTSYMSLFRYATCGDKMFAFVGFLCSMIFGAGQPAMMLVFG
jgi:hypothetical protein